MAGTLVGKVNPGHTVLLVVDVQNDGWSSDGALARAGRDISLARERLPNITALVDAARGRGVPVIFVRTLHND